RHLRRARLQRPAMTSSNSAPDAASGARQGTLVSQRVGLLSLQGVLCPVVRQTLIPFHYGIFFVQSSERPFHCYCSLSRLILPSTSGEFLELFAFDEAYLRRLREGDPSTEDHFVAYFSQLLQLK